MFAYCENNPVNGSDPDGDMVWWAAAALGGAAFEVASYLIGNAIRGQKSTWKCVGKAALTGAITGVALGAVGKGIQAVGKAAKAAKTAKAAKQASAISKGACFVAGTGVLTSDGYVSIEDIRAGDKVWAENTETGEKELKEVVRTFINETCELVHVCVNGEEIVATPEHPFYVLTKGWTGAGELHPGDILTLQSGDIAIVETVWYEALDDTIKVYNFEVEDFHTYYVGENAILVHNSCAMSAGRNVSAESFGSINNDVIDLPRVGKALKTDPHHAFSDIVDNYAGYATKSQIKNGTLYQLEGALNGKAGRFEWIIQNQQVTHRMFVKGGKINGVPIMP